MTNQPNPSISKTVRPDEVVGVLASQRPPEVRHLHLNVLPNQPDDPTTLEHVLQAVLAEVVSVWPDGTTWILEIGRGYVQGVQYPPDMLIEVGPQFLYPDMTAKAVALGWTDPRTIPREHTDYRSRPIWGDNPLQELDWNSVGIPQTVVTLAQAADDILGAVRGSRFELRIFAKPESEDSGETTEPAYAELPPEFGFQSDHDGWRWMYSDDPFSDQWMVVSVGKKAGDDQPRALCGWEAGVGLGYGGGSKRRNGWSLPGNYCHLELTDESGRRHLIGGNSSSADEPGCPHRDPVGPA